MSATQCIGKTLWMQTVSEAERSWNCPRCNEELGELNGYCEYCKEIDNIIVYNPDKYYIREIRIRHITSDEGASVTPQEELFAELFNHEKILVKDMDVLTLRAHREELAKIAFTARARLTAVDDEERKRKNKDNNGKPKGFERSLNIDETTKDAINVIKERQKKLTGKEKVLAGLAALFEKSGMSKSEALKEAETRMGAGVILARLKDDKSKDIITGKNEPKESSQPIPVFNPFEKK